MKRYICKGCKLRKRARSTKPLHSFSMKLCRKCACKTRPNRDVH